MALINCPECGATISDKATQCPHCGTPIAGVVTHPAEQSKKSSVWWIVLLTALIIVAITVISLTAIYVNNKKHDSQLLADSLRRDSVERVAAEMQAAQEAELHRQDSIRLAEEKRQTGYEAFMSKIRQHTPADAYGYWLYDITGDGFPELWIEGGTCEADRYLHVYSYNPTSGEVSQIYNGGSDHSGFFKSKGYVLQVFMYMAQEMRWKLTYSNGRISSTKIYDEGFMDNEDYVSPDIPGTPINYTSLSDTQQIRRIFDL